jgi:hypothetical protein
MRLRFVARKKLLLERLPLKNRSKRRRKGVKRSLRKRYSSVTYYLEVDWMIGINLYCLNFINWYISLSVHT